jgi:hypothetical protein
VEGETTYNILVVNLRTFLLRNLQKLEKYARGKEAKALRELYEKKEQNEGLSYLHDYCYIFEQI